jgi:hypothetical protein
MKNYKDNLLRALYMLRTALEDYDTEISHSILVGGGTDQEEDLMEQELEEYLGELDELILETWKTQGTPELISNNGKKLSNTFVGIE